MDQSISAFFEERKAAWLKKNLSASMSELEVTEKEQECESVFALKNWLPNAAKRAGQMSISTHPSKFSHPSTGVGEKNKKNYTFVTPIIFYGRKKSDGFLRTGNVAVAADALGNAAALDVYKFLTLITDDGQSVLQHLEQDSELAQVLLTFPNADEEHSYQTVKQGFLAMSANDDEVITNSKIKQVYFPIAKQHGETTYHQLSLLTASGIIFELRQRLDKMRFGEEIKRARDKRKSNEYHNGFREIYDLTTIGYGGTKPRNISVLNNQNGGKAHLLMSVPPALKNRDTHFPKVDFFQQSVHYFQCRALFHQLHTLYKRDDNNMHIRADRDELYQQIIDHLIEKMWQVRAVASEQYIDSASQLSKAQTTWLCPQGETLREMSDDWLDEIIQSITTFVFYGYEKVLGKKAIKLGLAERKHMEKIAEENKGALR
ncbi:type I-F CRISPR-associated protein Csy1 [Marinomonas sp. IMCC 4694]|uniref:type I-F CRISPR-associated protein Csy1 n=1 Tax=Marinomonas sp. IMCC 4694 TaxID=2605432 RepID=UPI001CA33C2F|nr:type I-F CRISPR-associated protein Csy1 [Marinomonas sp. IMCC 4694]